MEQRNMQRKPQMLREGVVKWSLKCEMWCNSTALGSRDSDCARWCDEERIPNGIARQQTWPHGCFYYHTVEVYVIYEFELIRSTHFVLRSNDFQWMLSHAQCSSNHCECIYYILNARDNKYV